MKLHLASVVHGSHPLPGAMSLLICEDIWPSIGRDPCLILRRRWTRAGPDLLSSAGEH